ncbi:hypothetical protein [Carboxylicivirga sp. RSCT41]|uniref:hypothetical protein n=1 Tax=Carboxylicivirga agarovorans TaxID=3417570 RepID=UPI003D327EBA
MKGNTPFYIVRGEFFRQNGNDIDTVEIYQEFRHAELIKARIKAFDLYNSYIDVLLESKGLRYENHPNTEQALKDFFSSTRTINSESTDIDVDMGKEIGIYFVDDNEIEYKSTEGKVFYKGEHLIHYIDNLYDDRKHIVFQNLMYESDYYHDNKLEMLDCLVKCDTSKLFERGDYQHILKTPIDFSNIDTQQYE